MKQSVEDDIEHVGSLLLQNPATEFASHVASAMHL